MVVDLLLPLSYIATKFDSALTHVDTFDMSVSGQSIETRLGSHEHGQAS